MAGKYHKWQEMQKVQQKIANEGKYSNSWQEKLEDQVAGKSGIWQEK